jgi:hypothetical protein
VSVVSLWNTGTHGTHLPLADMLIPTLKQGKARHLAQGHDVPRVPVFHPRRVSDLPLAGDPTRASTDVESGRERRVSRFRLQFRRSSVGALCDVHGRPASSQGATPFARLPPCCDVQPGACRVCRARPDVSAKGATGHVVLSNSRNRSCFPRRVAISRANRLGLPGRRRRFPQGPRPDPRMGFSKNFGVIGALLFSETERTVWLFGK